MDYSRKVDLADYDHPFWGLQEDNGSFPAKTYLFRKEGGGCSYALEDFFQHNGVFINGLRGTKAHSDSYMTIVCYEQLFQCLDILDKEYKPSAKDWLPAYKYWSQNSNMQPPLRLVAWEIKRRYKINE